MSASTPRRLLVVANRTAATPGLIDIVRSKAAGGETEVSLLVPAFPTVFDPEALETRHTLELAIPLLEEATSATVQGIVGDPDPFVAVRLAIQAEDLRRGHHLHAADTGLALGQARPAPEGGAARR